MFQFDLCDLGVRRHCQASCGHPCSTLYRNCLSTGWFGREMYIRVQPQKGIALMTISLGREMAT